MFGLETKEARKYFEEVNNIYNKVQSVRKEKCYPKLASSKEKGSMLGASCGFANKKGIFLLTDRVINIPFEITLTDDYWYNTKTKKRAKNVIVGDDADNTRLNALGCNFAEKPVYQIWLMTGNTEIYSYGHRYSLKKEGAFKSPGQNIIVCDIKNLKALDGIINKLSDAIEQSDIADCEKILEAHMYPAELENDKTYQIKLSNMLAGRNSVGYYDLMEDL